MISADWNLQVCWWGLTHARLQKNKYLDTRLTFKTTHDQRRLELAGVLVVFFLTCKACMRSLSVILLKWHVTQVSLSEETSSALHSIFIRALPALSLAHLQVNICKRLSLLTCKRGRTTLLYLKVLSNLTPDTCKCSRSRHSPSLEQAFSALRSPTKRLSNLVPGIRMWQNSVLLMRPSALRSNFLTLSALSLLTCRCGRSSPSPPLRCDQELH